MLRHKIDFSTFFPFIFVLQIYHVTKDAFKNRVALLITNMKFTDGKFNRNGAEKDEENMRKLLSALGYEVVKYTNLTGKVFLLKGKIWGKILCLVCFEIQ